ncbi:STAS domain-containing protein [bacterium]|nr:STAS domain-containing protein [bacterium]
MKMNVHEHEQVVVFELKGKIMGGPDAVVFHDTLKDYIGKGMKCFLIDLKKVDWMNSSGLGILISGLTTIKKAEGELKLARATEKISSLLMITKLITVFETYDTVEDALMSFTRS